MVTTVKHSIHFIHLGNLSFTTEEIWHFVSDKLNIHQCCKKHTILKNCGERHRMRVWISLHSKAIKSLNQSTPGNFFMYVRRESLTFGIRRYVMYVICCMHPELFRRRFCY